MTPIAMTFLVIAILVIWGGLAVSIIALVRSSDRPDTFGDNTPAPNTTT